MLRLNNCASGAFARRVIAQSQKRGYFYPGVGESGIYGATLRQYLSNMTRFVIVMPPVLVYQVMVSWSTSSQFAPFSSDLHISDGTVMEGEEAIANLRIQHERIMPFMEEIREKLEAAQ